MREKIRLLGLKKNSIQHRKENKTQESGVPLLHGSRSEINLSSHSHSCCIAYIATPRGLNWKIFETNKKKILGT